MNYRVLVKNVGVAFIAQGVALVLSIMQSLMVPKMMGTTQYGYWQLFVFYQSFVGFAHLGLNDGVYLLKGGQTRESIDKKSVNSQFAVGLFYQVIIACVMVVVACLGGFGPEREFVIASTGVFLVIQNASTFLMYLLQAINETRRSSYATIVERLSFLVPLLVLLVLRCDSYRVLIVSYIFSGLVQLVYCLCACRDFIVSGLEPVPRALCQSASSIRVGFKLVVANLASQLILGVARFAIDAAWGIDAFGQLSFALSLASFFLAFVSQASMVLFPFLRQAEMDEAKRFFGIIRDSMTVFFPIIYVLYYPMVLLLTIWLPKYADSFVFFAFIIPICVFDSKMNICCCTYFKVLRRENLLLKINSITCVASALFAVCGVVVFHSIYAVIVGAVVAIVCRSLWSEAYLSRRLAVPSSRAAVSGELVLTFIFTVTALALPPSAAFAIYCVAYILFLLIFHRQAKCLLGKLLRPFLGYRK